MPRRALLALLLLGGTWGAVYPLTSIALRGGLPPVWLITIRAAGAVVLLVPFAAATSGLRPLAARPLALIAASLLQATIPLWLLTVAQQHVSAGVAGILSTLQPVFTALVVAFLCRHLNVHAWTGIGVGASGAVLLAGPAGGHTDLVAALMVVVSAALFAVGAVFIGETLVGIPSAGIAAAAMALTTITFLPVAIVTGPPAELDPAAMFSAAALAILTAAPLALFYRLIREVGAERAALAWYVAPAAAVVYDIPLAGLPSHSECAGLALVILAVAITHRANREVRSSA